MRLVIFFVMILLFFIISIGPSNNDYPSNEGNFSKITGNFFVALNKLVVYVTNFFSKIFEKMKDYA